MSVRIKKSNSRICVLHIMHVTLNGNDTYWYMLHISLHFPRHQGCTRVGRSFRALQGNCWSSARGRRQFASGGPWGVGRRSLETGPLARCAGFTWGMHKVRRIQHVVLVVDVCEIMLSWHQYFIFHDFSIFRKPSAGGLLSLYSCLKTWGELQVQTVRCGSSSSTARTAALGRRLANHGNPSEMMNGFCSNGAEICWDILKKETERLVDLQFKSLSFFHEICSHANEVWVAWMMVMWALGRF